MSVHTILVGTTELKTAQKELQNAIAFTRRESKLCETLILTEAI